MPASGWKLWRDELRAPAPEDQRHTRPTDPQMMLGYWRIEGARTKPDYPVLIFQDESISDGVVCQIGRQRPFEAAVGQTAWDQFVAGSWLKCIAVEKGAWDSALETGAWPDGKASRQQTTEEKAGVAEAEGSNQAPVDEKYGAEIRELAAEITALPEPADQKSADHLAGLVDKMNTLLKLAEAERVKEKEPHLTASREVDTKWRGITEPGTDAKENGDTKRKAFLKKEQKRLADIAAEENRKRIAAAEEERKRIEAETAARLKAEAEARAKELEENGEDASEAVPTDEEIAARAAEVAAESVAPVEEVQAQRATAGSAFGTRRGLKKVKKGEITDAKKFAAALIDIKHGDLMDLLQQLANRAAKAGMPQPGMKIIEVEE